MGIFIGLDQSYTSTGYCVLNDKISPQNSIIEFGVYKTSMGDGTIYNRAIMITNSIIELCKKYPNAAISIEGLSFGQRGNATRDLAGLQFVIITSLQTKLCINDTKIIAPQSVKKFATGSGGSAKKKVTKIDMINALPPIILQKFIDGGFKKSSGLYDVTDAYWIAKYTHNNTIEGKL